MKIKTGLIGFGRTGKAVASVVLQNTEFSLEWVYRKTTVLEHRSVPEFLGLHSEEPGLIFSAEHISIQDLLDQHSVDVLIDFSSADSIHAYGRYAADKNIKIISAISHYGEDELALLNELAKLTTVFWSPNITLGVNYLLFSAKFLQRIAPGVDIEIIEEHFKQKEGVSGTAVKIAHALDLDISQINSVRAGGIVGKHELIFGFPYQTVRLIHESISREAFGNGAIFVARNLMPLPSGLYNFEDLLRPYFKF